MRFRWQSNSIAFWDNRNSQHQSPVRASRHDLWRSALLEHDPEKACPGLDPGWKPVFGKILLKTKAMLTRFEPDLPA
jgi:hypothetical protein